AFLIPSIRSKKQPRIVEGRNPCAVWYPSALCFSLDCYLLRPRAHKKLSFSADILTYALRSLSCHPLRVLRPDAHPIPTTLTSTAGKFPAPSNFWARSASPPILSTLP